MTTELEKLNASQMPKHYYCRHMQPGVCKYNTEIVLVDTDAVKQMIGGDAIGKPVYVLHNTAPNDERMKNLEKESDGYIIDSFYNELDGWAWFEFLVVSDKGHAAVGKGWSVSNAYVPTEWGPGGTKNNVPYDREIVNGAFTHLAIVPDPRYEDACIMTSEQFRSYQDSKKRELAELQNSKSEPSGGKKMFKLFKTKREEVNAIDPDTEIELENGKVVKISEMMNALKVTDDAAEAAKKKADEDAAAAKAAAEKKNAKDDDEKINGDSMVECEGEKMPLKELVNKYNAKMKANAESEDDEKKKKADADKKEKENADKEKESEEEKANSHFRELQNAAGIKPAAPPVMETSMDKTARGKAHYGSSKAA